MIMKKFFKLFGVNGFSLLIWEGILIFVSYFLFLIYEQLCGVFIGWFVTDTYYSLKELRGEFEK